MRSAVTNLEGALNLARLEALRRNSSVTVCAVANPHASPPQDCLDDDAGWDTGWIVFADRNFDLNFDAADELVRVYDALPDGLTLRQKNPHDHFRFKGSGTSNADASSFLLCDERGFARARAVSVSFIGRISSPAPSPKFSTCPGP